MTKKIKSVFRFQNGMIVVCDYNDKQIPSLQGMDSSKLRKKINKLIDENTELYGYLPEMEAVSRILKR